MTWWENYVFIGSRLSHLGPKRVSEVTDDGIMMAQEVAAWRPG
jgi:hypothetical protein